MPVYGNSFDVLANDSHQALQGSRIEWVPPNANALISLAETGEATGLESEMFAADTAVKERGGVSIQNRIPILEDIVFSGLLVAALTRLQLTYHNTTAGALFAFWRVECELVA